jgi:hypothetical protein
MRRIEKMGEKKWRKKRKVEGMKFEEKKGG